MKINFLHFLLHSSMKKYNTLVILLQCYLFDERPEKDESPVESCFYTNFL